MGSKSEQDPRIRPRGSSAAAWMWDEHAKALRPPGSKYFKRRQKSLVSNGAIVAAISDKDDANRAVTLQDVKALAIQHIDVAHVQRMHLSTAVLFDDIIQSAEMDNFLWAVLLYFDALQAHQTTLNSENVPTPGMQRDRAKQALEYSAEKVAQTKVDLGKAYMTLIMGLGNTHCHHSLQGRLKHSRTDTDRDLYEAIYETTIFTTWITFGYKYWDEIHREIGGTLRSTPFNRDIHHREESQPSKPLLDKDGQGLASQMEESELIAYKVHFDRPAVGELSRLHSPAFTWLLPSTKERSAWAFRPPYRPANMHKCTMAVTPGAQSFYPEKVGVIGTPISECDSATLRRVDKTDNNPLDAELSELIDRDESDSGESDDDGGGDDYNEKDNGSKCTEQTS